MAISLCHEIKHKTITMICGLPLTVKLDAIRSEYSLAVFCSNRNFFSLKYYKSQLTLSIILNNESNSTTNLKLSELSAIVSIERLIVSVIVSVVSESIRAVGVCRLYCLRAVRPVSLPAIIPTVPITAVTVCTWYGVGGGKGAGDPVFLHALTANKVPLFPDLLLPYHKEQEDEEAL